MVMMFFRYKIWARDINIELTYYLHMGRLHSTSYLTSDLEFTGNQNEKANDLQMISYLKGLKL